MKRRIWWLGFILLAGGMAVIFMRRAETPASLVANKLAPASDGMTLTTITDPVRVFQKAFWRRMANDDLILHAERREWSSPAEGIRKWQWFLVVRPGPALLDWLATNPFSLAVTTSPLDGSGSVSAPDWFPKVSKDFLIEQKADGGFTLMWSADSKLLYARDSGFGFGLPDTVR